MGREIELMLRRGRCMKCGLERRVVDMLLGNEARGAGVWNG